MMLGVGNIIAFVVALIAIKTFIQYVQKNSLKAFGIYRIIVGIVILGLTYGGYIKA
jgi:undecaprenyl-diphosphatase